MMTTMSAILGTTPVVIGIGVGADLRQPWGAAVGGLILSQALSLYTIPVTYVYMEEFSEWLGRVLGGRPRTKSREIPRDRSLVPACRYPPPAE